MDWNTWIEYLKSGTILEFRMRVKLIFSSVFVINNTLGVIEKNKASLWVNKFTDGILSNKKYITEKFHWGRLWNRTYYAHLMVSRSNFSLTLRQRLQKSGRERHLLSFLLQFVSQVIVIELYLLCCRSETTFLYCNTIEYISHMVVKMVNCFTSKLSRILGVPLIKASFEWWIIRCNPGRTLRAVCKVTRSQYSLYELRLNCDYKFGRNIHIEIRISKIFREI